MKRIAGTGAAGFACLLAGLAITGCEWLDVPASATGSGITGTWTYIDTAGSQSKWVLVQEDDTSIVGVGSQSGTNNVSISGHVNNDYVNMTLTYSDESIFNLSGTVADDVMSGSFTNSAAASGSWTAVKTRQGS